MLPPNHAVYVAAGPDRRPNKPTSNTPETAAPLWEAASRRYLRDPATGGEPQAVGLQNGSYPHPKDKIGSHPTSNYRYADPLARRPEREPHQPVEPSGPSLLRVSQYLLVGKPLRLEWHSRPAASPPRPSHFRALQPHTTARAQTDQASSISPNRPTLVANHALASRAQENAWRRPQAPSHPVARHTLRADRVESAARQLHQIRLWRAKNRRHSGSRLVISALRPFRVSSCSRYLHIREYRIQNAL